jgi:hypothetical protein
MRWWRDSPQVRLVNCREYAMVTAVVGHSIGRQWIRCVLKYLSLPKDVQEYQKGT